MKPRLVILLLGLALLGTLWLGSAGFDAEPMAQTESYGPSGLPALARILLGNAS